MDRRALLRRGAAALGLALMPVAALAMPATASVYKKLTCSTNGFRLIANEAVGMPLSSSQVQRLERVAKKMWDMRILAEIRWGHSPKNAAGEGLLASFNWSTTGENLEGVDLGISQDGPLIMVNKRQQPLEIWYAAAA